MVTAAVTGTSCGVHAAQLCSGGGADVAKPGPSPTNTRTHAHATQTLGITSDHFLCLGGPVLCQ